MLSGLAVAGALTALLAGIAGAWSPCGFSMVDTIGSALGDARRGVTAAASATFALGALAGGVVTFGGLSLAGAALGSGSTGLRDAIAGALAIAAAFADWRGWRIAPQIRRQVPERWRWIMPLPIASSLYGLLLGLGFTTFVLSFAVWALAGISVAAGSPALGLAVGLAFGAGRALPVLWIAPRLGSRAGDRALEALALEPRMWLGMRRLDAVGLGACAALLAGQVAAAAPIPASTDPSADRTLLVWQQVGGRGVLDTHTALYLIPGHFPAVGGHYVAWVGRHAIVIARGAHRTPVERVPLPLHATVDALAISGEWLVVRDAGERGIANLFAISIANPTRRRYLAGSSVAGAIGRPTIEGVEVAWSYSTPRSSRIIEVNASTGGRTVLRGSVRNVQYSNPSLFEGRLLYVRTDRCTQELVLGSPLSTTLNHILVTLPSAVTRDPGWEVGYTKAYNTASLCPNRPTGPGGAITLGATALGTSEAYVVESPRDLAQTQIQRIYLTSQR